jgi:uroporphyrinogen-III synthase
LSAGVARVLVLRQAPEAAQTASDLRARGHEAILLPLSQTVSLGLPPPEGAFSGFVVTSLQAVEPLAAAFPGDGRPVLAVGERTRQALVSAGFATVETGSGTAAGLLERAAAIAGDGGAGLLYAAGRVRTAKLEADAGAAGVQLTVWEVYDLEPRRPDADELEAALSAFEPSDVLILSVGQAEGFAVAWERMAAERRPVPRLLCLSERILRALPVDLASFACISPQPKLSSLFDRFLPPSLEDGGSR